MAFKTIFLKLIVLKLCVIKSLAQTSDLGVINYNTTSNGFLNEGSEETQVDFLKYIGRC